MKRLLFIIFIISIGSYLTVQYFKDRRYNPPSNYDYVISEDIDRDYYDPSVLENYYQSALEVGSYARSLWYNEGLDVRFPDDEKFESIEAMKHYNQLIVAVKTLEDQLVYSKMLKDEGFSDDEVIMMLKNEMEPSEMELIDSEYLIGLQIGDKGSEVWDLQLLLNNHGDSIPVDGIFSVATLDRVIAIQESAMIYPSGEIDEKTLKAILTK